LTRSGSSDGAHVRYLSPEALVPKEHPLRLIRPLANAALERPSASFHQMYSAIGRPSIRNGN